MNPNAMQHIHPTRQYNKFVSRRDSGQGLKISIPIGASSIQLELVKKAYPKAEILLKGNDSK